jgi:hypothetical protein
MKKLEEPDVTKEIEALYRRIDKRIAKYGELNDEEIGTVISDHRTKKSAK